MTKSRAAAAWLVDFVVANVVLLPVYALALLLVVVLPRGIGWMLAVAITAWAATLVVVWRLLLLGRRTRRTPGKRALIERVDT